MHDGIRIAAVNTAVVVTVGAPSPCNAVLHPEAAVALTARACPP